MIVPDRTSSALPAPPILSPAEAEAVAASLDSRPYAPVTGRDAEALTWGVDLLRSLAGSVLNSSWKPDPEFLDLLGAAASATADLVRRSAA